MGDKDKLTPKTGGTHNICTREEGVMRHIREGQTTTVVDKTHMSKKRSERRVRHQIKQETGNRKQETAPFLT